MEEMQSTSGYGRAAVAAAKNCKANPTLSPRAAWDAAVANEFASEESRKKSCPRGTFLGLCDEGLLEGVRPCKYGTSVDNKSYAIQAVQVLTRDGSLSKSVLELWKRVSPEGMRHNSQMHVVNALWNKKLLTCQ